MRELEESGIKSSVYMHVFVRASERVGRVTPLERVGRVRNAVVCVSKCVRESMRESWKSQGWSRVYVCMCEGQHERVGRERRGLCSLKEI